MSDLLDAVQRIAISQHAAKQLDLDRIAGPYTDPLELLRAARDCGGEARVRIVALRRQHGDGPAWVIYAPGVRRDYRSEFRAAMKREAHVGPKVTRPKDFARGSDGRKHAR